MKISENHKLNDDDHAHEDDNDDDDDDDDNDDDDDDDDEEDDDDGSNNFNAHYNRHQFRISALSRFSDVISRGNRSRNVSCFFRLNSELLLTATFSFTFLLQ